ncbi:glycoside hydrolase family 16 protein [Moniliophthora roreri MCA 2997]|uniref:Glycoside hydrolase family 16 protein n=1 Tax=Moniliophthora roreri (strain MCA 2997) TaxID=1381753 RepID=V2X9H8_MONRO|nr:glycoside hydrolase family 16 protein [Moniliophthora roreri MCA 2997]
MAESKAQAQTPSEMAQDPFASPVISRRSSLRANQSEPSSGDSTASLRESNVLPGDEDRERDRQIQAEAQRRQTEEELANATSYLASQQRPRNHYRSYTRSGPSTPTSASFANIPTPYSVMSTHTNSPAVSFVPLPGSNSANASSTAIRKAPAPRMRSTLLPALMHRPALSFLTEKKDNADNDPTNPYKDPTHSEVPKPWLQKPSPRILISYLMVYGMILLGFGAGALQCYFTYRDVKYNRMDRAQLCKVFEDDFSDGPEAWKNRWFREVDMSGFGNGQFEMTTSSDKNVYVEDGKLWLMPTLTAESLGDSGWNNVFGGDTGVYTYNITDCTFNQTAKDAGFIDNPKGGGKIFDYDGYARACSATANSTAGTIIPPVQSARISTKFFNGTERGEKGSVKYGRVEVRAKMPRGDWLWPAIWMLPTDDAYGSWPRSGEIDIVESRGNDLRYTNRGRNYVQGALNWGPTPALNGVGKSYSWWSDKRKGFDEGFHTYVLEWTPSWIRIYVDTRLHTLLEIKFDHPFFERGDFPSTIINSTTGALEQLADPWASSGQSAKNRWSAPFDKDFYLILNVAVGGTNGWFPEVQGNKPWFNSNGRDGAMRDFALAKERWLPSWGTGQSRAMVVDYVRMYERCSA